MACPAAEALAAMATGDLPPERRAEIANHAAGCAPCRAALDALFRSRAPEPPADPRGSTQTAKRAPAVRGEPVDDRPRPRRRLAPGDWVDRYVIEAVLGQGGMGVVYRARDPDLGRAVAIKVLRPGSEGGVRLRREAQALAKLSHPNVVAVHDVGIQDGQPFIAMALVEGETLRQWLATPRARRAVLDVLLDAGRGIAAAHAVGLIHRDLKPDNIFVAHSGAALVGDFGLARGIDGAGTEPGGDAAGDELATALTRSGALLGTPAYMAPEQAAGEPTPASDQFSFCVTAWEALTGARPFAGTTIAELLDNIRSGAVTEPGGDRALPSRLDAALRRGLAADPARRFPSMTALLSALEPAGDAAAAHESAAAERSPARARRPSRRAASVAIASAGVAAGVIALLLAMRTRSAPPAGSTIVAAAAAGAELPPTFAPLAGWLGDWDAEDGSRSEHWIAAAGAVYGVSLQPGGAFEVMIVDDGEGPGKPDGVLRLFTMPGGERTLELRQRAITERGVLFANDALAFPKTIRYQLEGETLRAVLGGDGGKEVQHRFRRGAARPAPELEAADRAHAADTARRGVDGWAAAFEPQGRLLWDGVKREGAEIAEAMAQILASGHIDWAPIASRRAGALGFTVDKATFTGRRPQDSWRGSSVTIWRKQADGTWKILFDTGRLVQE